MADQRAKRMQAIFLVLGAALSTAVMGVFAKEALARGSDAQALLGVRYAITGIVLGIPLALSGALPFASSRERGWVLAIGIGMVFGGLAEFEALSRLPLSVVIVILFVSPLWVALYSRIVRKERLGWLRQGAFALVFSGIVLLVGLKLDEYDVPGLLCALGSSFVWAAILIMIQEGTGSEGFTPPVAVASGAVVAAVVAAVIQPVGVADEIGREQTLGWVFAVGLAAAVGFGLLALGMRGQHIFDVSVVAASEPLFAATLGAIFLSERLSAWQLLGVGLVTAGVALIARAHDAPRAHDPPGATGLARSGSAPRP